MIFTATDEKWMQEALLCAKQASAQQEVPVGAVLVYNNKIIGRGFNSPIRTSDPTAHAEIMALRDGAKNIGNYRLLNATLYVTLEPCQMCAAALVHARLYEVVYGAADPKAGAVNSQCQSLQRPFLNHQVMHRSGLMAKACAGLLQDFFRSKRW